MGGSALESYTVLMGNRNEVVPLNSSIFSTGVRKMYTSKLDRQGAQLHDSLFQSVRGYQSIDVHRLGLANAMSPVNSLHVLHWIPIMLQKDYSISACKSLFTFEPALTAAT